MRRRVLAIALVALCSLGALEGRAQSEPSSPWLDQALEAYATALQEGERDTRIAGFGRAQRLFQNAVTAGGQNAALQTNLGNAALLAEQRGHAVLAYRRALLLDADFPRALQNLEHTRSLQPPWVPRPAPAGLFDGFSLYRAIPRAERALAAATAFAVGGLLIGASIRWRRTTLRGAGILAWTAWAILFGATTLERYREDTTAAVVTADEAPARSADSVLAPLAFPEPLPGGTEVDIVERRPPWVRIRLANGRDAWTQESSVTRVEP